MMKPLLGSIERRWAMLAIAIATVPALSERATAQLSGLKAPAAIAQGTKDLSITAPNIAPGTYQVRFVQPGTSAAAVTKDAKRIDSTTLVTDASSLSAGGYQLTVLSQGRPDSPAGTLSITPPSALQLTVPELPEITRDQQIVIHGKGFIPGPYDVVLAKSTDGLENGIVITGVATTDQLTFTPPSSRVATGRYLVWVRAGSQTYQAPGDLRLIADTQAAVSIEAINPVTVYPEEANGPSFEITGKNLGYTGNNNVILIKDRGALSVGTPDECETSKSTHIYRKACLVVDPGMEGTKVQVLGFPRGRFDGPVAIAVRVGNNTSTYLPLTFSRVKQSTAGVVAIGVFLGILAITAILALLAGGTTIAGKQFNAFQSLLLDRETETYSLSKFQLFAWMWVFVFGYLYLFTCRLLIQWRFELPPVPDGLPGMLAISAGTVVTATAATAAVGSKGSGDVHPSLADFISTGGTVAGERFQYFVWTIVGVLGFLAMLLLTNPATLVELPKIPDGFLYVMGISSVGYLAGKVVRKPGPNIRSLVIANIGRAPNPPDNAPVNPLVNPPGDGGAGAGGAQMVIRILGENLDRNATVAVDANTLLLSQYSIVGIQPPLPTSAASSFCTEIQVTLLAADKYLVNEHTITLVNSDGQSASGAFPVNATKIGSAIFDGPGTTLTVSGKNFDERSTVRWISDGPGNPTVDLVPAWNADRTSFDARFPLPVRADGMLVITNPSQLRATFPVKAPKASA